ncbi:hypothetical protein A3A46_02130 [Candidatus Roizmanbacteria bacterium RIFCSPLOWO2_01_FULL_37_13]|uniref:hydroxymethylglutaryl-CoA reductase (NADPH) n=1 Tax=Candidatus Roizmanbacteria bacterium RIFCSPHIGHO2_02_FULL_38_11 TaxID=1802039 RepID=A0A1F7GX41_9BACT|nr:MAG: hypothetical protein A3C25_00895 [Candidatus Roizmanbacteria bacterium RIFCSPHIGHO2_02_FULL_38_11]OGK33490.1 MAG: hypothetical protein A3F58_00850 [Candidatus Roizmanbacteria bacterium RIFCSPHIGHO2_12_FULL_37_9b]OGK42883.1 MAG: hypothetical protein A3A46_02130 [Candidatus Roizmanbacteria bacterium RIFCSPLOWO2_01_FULL_37_13]
MILSSPSTLIDVNTSNLFKRLSEFKSPKERRDFLKNKLKIKLDLIEKALVEKEKDLHCENLVGATILPLGVAGPLKIESEKLKVKSYYIPLATTEGALVASVNRGCKAITLSGGAYVNTHRIGATRGPVFYTGSIRKGEYFYRWLKKNSDQIAKVAESTSSHLKFKKYDIKTVADYAYVRFYYDTQDAMGMNMATIATQKIIEMIEKETKIKCLSIAGNFDNDKKPAWINFINNRGFKAWGEVILSKKVIREVLKSRAEDIFEVWLAKCMVGSAMSGSSGFNSHFANVIAAFFAATGQDLAHVVEGSLGITIVKVLDNGSLYFSVYLPALMLGTVGGGTQLKTKQEALSIVGAKTSLELAEVLAGVVLAGEISLLASLAEGTLAKVHERLGR